MFNEFKNQGTDWKVEAGFKKTVDLSHKIVELTVLGGWSYRVVRNLIQYVNKTFEPDPAEIQTRLDDLDEKLATMTSWCTVNSQLIPRDMYDSSYTRLPQSCQTYFDSVSLIWSTYELASSTCNQ
jgi:hypothetical protein